MKTNHFCERRTSQSAAVSFVSVKNIHNSPKTVYAYIEEAIFMYFTLTVVYEMHIEQLSIRLLFYCVYFYGNFQSNYENI